MAMLCMLPALIQTSPVWVPSRLPSISEKALKLPFVSIHKLLLRFRAVFFYIPERRLFAGKHSWGLRTVSGSRAAEARQRDTHLDLAQTHWRSVWTPLDFYNPPQTCFLWWKPTTFPYHLASPAGEEKQEHQTGHQHPHEPISQIYLPLIISV